MNECMTYTRAGDGLEAHPGTVAADSQHLVVSQQPPGQVLNQGPSALPGLHPLIHIGQLAGGAPGPGREQSPAPLPVCRAGAKGYDEGARSHPEEEAGGLPSVGSDSRTDWLRGPCTPDGIPV